MPVPGVIHIGSVDDLEQPDMHLSGPGLLITQKKRLNAEYGLSLHQVIRYDYLYQELPLFVSQNQDFKDVIHRKFIIDLYAGIDRYFPLRKSWFTVSFGMAYCGLNSSYVETKIIYQTSTSYKEYKIDKNFRFPAVTTGIGWQKKKFLGELKFGYCWNNPTLFDTPFIFPEINLSYQLFNWPKLK